MITVTWDLRKKTSHHASRHTGWKHDSGRGPLHEPHSWIPPACIQFNPTPRRAYWSSQIPDVHGHQMFMKDPSPSGDTQPSFLTAFQTRNVGAILYFPLSLCLVNHWDIGCCFLYFSQICLFLSTPALVWALIHRPGHTNRLTCSWHGPQGHVHGCSVEVCQSQLCPEPWALSPGPLHGPATERSAWPSRGSGPGSAALAFFSDWATTCCYMILVSPLFFLLWTYINFFN